MNSEKTSHRAHQAPDTIKRKVVRRGLLVICLISLGISSFAQEQSEVRTRYVGPFNQVWTTPHEGSQRETVVRLENGLYQTTRYADNGQVVRIAHYIDAELDTLDADYMEYFSADGQVLVTGAYRRGEEIGEWVGFYPDGKRYFTKTYADGEIQEEQYYDHNGNGVPRAQLESEPEFPGGQAALMRYLATNITYPKEARKKDISGKVYIAFVIDATGQVVAPTVLRSVHPALDEEALRVVRSLPVWTPGTRFGQPARQYYMLPINYSLR